MKNDVNAVVQEYFKLKKKMIEMGVQQPVGFSSPEVAQMLRKELPELRSCEGVTAITVDGVSRTDIFIIDWNWLPSELKAHFSTEAIGL